MRATQPTDEELLAHHFNYEIDQMVGALHLLGKLTIAGDPIAQAVLNNALIESFSVHARALLEFFEKKRGARRFAVEGYKPFKGVDTSGWIRLLNNQIMHLLDGRTADNSKKMAGPERVAINNALNAEFAAFKNAPLKPEFAAINIHDIPQYVLTGTVPGSTNEPTSI